MIKGSYRDIVKKQVILFNMTENYIPRLKEKYLKEIVPSLKKELGLKNDMAVPKLVKICINQGVGCATADKKIFDTIFTELGNIAGQKPIAKVAKKSISNFKLREGVNIGCMVTLRRNTMYEFFDRLVNIVLPRVRDFNGVSKDAFDNGGVYNLGIKEQIIFPEIVIDKVVKILGMNISIVTNTTDKNKAYCLLKSLGMPFRI